MTYVLYCKQPDFLWIPGGKFAILIIMRLFYPSILLLLSCRLTFLSSKKRLFVVYVNWIKNCRQTICLRRTSGNYSSFYEASRKMSMYVYYVWGRTDLKPHTALYHYILKSYNHVYINWAVSEEVKIRLLANEMLAHETFFLISLLTYWRYWMNNT